MHSIFISASLFVIELIVKKRIVKMNEMIKKLFSNKEYEML